ncbi:MAG: hypothetical protein AB7O62_10120 [Pirellulales bacterium]
MGEINRQIKIALAAAHEMPDGSAKVALLEEAVRQADSLQDIYSGYRARNDLAFAAWQAGMPDKMLVTFSWCLSQLTRHPEYIESPLDIALLIWGYRGCLACAISQPQIAKHRILALLDDLERRLNEWGQSLRCVHYLRWKIPLQMGDMGTAIEYEKKWRSSQESALDDCQACELAQYVELLILQGRDEDAVAAAEPIVRGDFDCPGARKNTMRLLVRALVRLDRVEMASEIHRRRLKLVLEPPVSVYHIAEVLLYHVHTNDLTKGVKLFEKHLPPAIETTDIENRFLFYLSSMLLFEAIAARGRGRRKLSLPKALPCWRDDDTYQAADLASWFGDQAADIAAQFNARNGNDYFTRQMENAREFAFACREVNPKNGSSG